MRQATRGAGLRRGTVALLAALAALALGAVAPAQAQDEGTAVLVLHGASAPATDAGVASLQAIGTAEDITVDATADPADIAADNLEGYEAVVFLNLTGDVLSDEQAAALEAYIAGGGGFVGIGSAAEVEPGQAFFDGLIGARPAASSPGATADKVVTAGDRVHIATRDLPLNDTRSDIWYEWQSRPTGTVHTLARYRAPTAPAGDGTNIGGTDHPISWCRDYEGGRSFYTGMGRTAASYDAELQSHLTGALQWATGLARANCKATINASYTGKRIVQAGPESTGLANTGESHGLTVAENGWVVYIGRGDCRTDAARGALLGLNSLGRIFDHANPNVGIGCGSVHIYDPAEDDGAVNSGVTLAGTLAVYGDGGQGGERTDDDNHKMEYGLIGATVAPDFAETGHIYLQYFPTFNPNTVPAGLPVERRISKMSRPRISRFTIDLDTKELDLASEVRVFEYDAQIYSCCHVGGGMGFDSAGNLYVTTGDTNSSQGSGGYSGNNPVAKCPVGPNDQPSSDHCGSANYSYQDARRTAGNTNDYNGKMLRIKPIPTVPDGAQTPPGVGTTYDLPTAADPNGPNLFDGTEGGGGKAKPEIYAMGLRNPSRLAIDPETDIPYTAWVGPDAAVPHPQLGPSTYENASMIDRAGNYGWPYCMGNGQAYRDRLANGQPRTDSPPGYVPGGPATGGTEGWYDCSNLRNDSPNNTGLVEFPHQTGTGMDAGKVRPVNIWYSRGNPDPDGDGNVETPANAQRTLNGCPDYPRPRGATAAPDYSSATPTQLCPYIVDNGMTVMAGPVYRYDGEAGDDSRRWPEYWDGRWFLHNSGGPSVKHALLFDEATAKQGAQPVYADSLRNMLSWDAAYMDSKFGPDGALYVQVYDGFFRAGENAGIYRFDYTGGPATPGANPTGVAIGDFQVRYSSAGSGGVSYEWEFGDGQTSTEANPTHTYAAAGPQTATLTVSYADGSTDSKTVTVDVLAEPDEDAPVTVATFDPAQPGNGGTYTRAVTVSLAATDTGGSGLETIEYRIDGGEWTTYTAPIRRSQPGEYTIEFRASDRSGNVEEIKTVSFTVELPDNCETNINDEFDGTELSDDWEVLRPTPAALSVADGFLNLEIQNGTDMIGGDANARNVLLKDAPDGSWIASTKLDVSDLEDGGEQAGMILWSGENPNNFAKIVFIEKGGSRQFEYVATRGGQADIRVGPSFGTDPDEVYLRVSTNGAGTFIAEGSFDGEEWQQINAPFSGIGDPASIKVGLKTSDGDGPGNTARYDWFRVDCSDVVAPESTATVTPAEPDGELGWYTTPPTVELTADDGSLGEIAKIEYSIDGGPLQTYTAPFTITEPGEHVVEYFATDSAEEPNVEEPKRLGLRLDATAPETEATLVQSGGENGPVEVTLAADDGEEGSGSVLTQYRVDGGPWRTYSAEDEQIFDGSQASLDQWEQAGAGFFELDEDGSGAMTPVGGLGMLWYPQKAYGDFRLKLQFREGRTDGGYSNGGVFTRFPDPRTPLAQREDECSRLGNAANDPAWVAIYCGHEIQLFDGPDGPGIETRKTGSIYLFDDNSLEEIGTPKPLGQWEDYEIEVRGQQYRVFRNGELIQEFENAPGLEPNRDGDPPTDLRQFAEGFIGLQNHGGADVMEYRNIRVEDLSADSPQQNETGPFTVSGIGPHTIEVRSVDAAGNVEPMGVVDVEIGRQQPPGPTGGSGTTPVPPMTDTPSSFRLGKVAARLSAKSLRKKGLTVPVACTGAMTGEVTVTVSRKVARKLGLPSNRLMRRAANCYGAHTARVTLKPSKALGRKLDRGKGTITLNVAVRMTDAGQPVQSASAKVRLKR